MRKSFGLLTILILLGLGGVLVYFLSQSSNSLEVDDTSALFGGKLEFGYISAGYLITQTDNSSKICGMAAITNDTIITAAHCVDDAVKMYAGKGLFTANVSALIPVNKAIQKAGWVSNEIRSDDFAILSVKGEDYFQSFAEVAAPVEGCFYKIIAYGRTGDQNAITRERKSSTLCVFDITEKTFKVRGEDSGICFGDSGSPIYFNDTNKVVGVIASIVLENEASTEPCSFGNTATVVRADTNIRLINENIVNAVDQIEVSATDEIDIEVADETLLEKLGLRKFDSLSQQEKNVYYLAATLTVTIVLILLTLVLVFKPEYMNTKRIN